MKKSLLWMFAAILTSGMTMTSCSTEDNEVNQKESSKFMDSFDFEDGDVSMFQIVDPARMTVGVENVDGSNAAKFTRSNSSSRGMAFYNFSDYAENAKTMKISFDFMIPAAILAPSAITIGDATVHNPTFAVNEGQYGYTSNGAIFNIGATRGKAYGGGNENYFWINDKVAAASQEEIKADDLWGKWMHVDLFIDLENRQYTYDVQKDGKTIFSGETEFLSENAKTCTQIDICSGNSGTYYLDNLKITKLYSDKNIKYADYTIRFVDTEGNPVPEDLKAPIVRRGKVGTAVTLLDSDKANMQTADGSMKYIYQSDDSENSKIAESGTVVTVVFKAEEVEKYKYILNGMIDGVSGLDGRLFMFQGEEFVGKTTTFYLPVGCGKNGAYYFVTPKQYNGYDVSINGTEETTGGYVLTTVNYVLDPNVVFFGECEDLEQEGDFGTPYAQGTFNRVSQGKGAQPKIGASIFTPVIPAGTYDVSLYGRNDKNNTSRTDVLYVKAVDGTVTKVAATPNPETWGNATMGWIVFSGVTIPEGGSLVIKNETETESISYDCIKVAKPAPAEE